MPFVPMIIFKVICNSINYLSHWSEASNLTWKSLVRRDSTLFFWSTRHCLCLLAAWIASVNCICIAPSGNLVGLAKRCLSLTQCMREISRFHLTLLTVNFPFESVRMAYPEHADWIPSESSSCRCLIPSGGDNISWIRPLMTVESSMLHKTSTSCVVKNAGGKAAGGKATLTIQTFIVSFVYRYLYRDLYSDVYCTFSLSLYLSQTFIPLLKSLWSAHSLFWESRLDRNLCGVFLRVSFCSR